MKILVYGINFSPELTGIGKYTGEMVEWMVAQGHEVRVITAPPYYPEWAVHDGYSNHKFHITNGNAKIIRCPLYVPRNLSTTKRLIHLASFAISSFIPLMGQIRWKPDYILSIAPTLLCVPGAILLSKITGAKSLLHIQDYEIDAMLGLGLVNKGMVSRLAIHFERWCLNGVDFVSTISQSMMQKAIEKGVAKSKLFFFPNWSELERFKTISPESINNLRQQLDLPEGKKVILYAGNLGEKQGLESIIEVAERTQGENYVFLIVGQGGGKDKLVKHAAEKGLKNVVFKPLQPYELLPALLCLADCHLVIQKRGAADAVLPSKLTNILAIGGNAVITAESQTELGRLCLNYPGIAVCIEPESSAELEQGIKRCLLLPHFNVIAQNYAESNLDKHNVLSTFMSYLSLKDDVYNAI